MGRVKSALEIALEKADKVGVLSPEEKEKLQDEAKIAEILKDFFQGRIDSNSLWQKLRGSKPSVLRMAQMTLIDSVSINSLQEQMESRQKGILAIETLKDRQNTVVIESSLKALAVIKKEYEEVKAKVAADLRKHVESNPQLRMKPVRTPDGKTMMQMAVTVDEAVKAKMDEFLSEHEEQYTNEFSVIIEELKIQIK
jgi:hypothetical protein